MPQRIQRKRVKGWRLPEGAICVGRGTRWGNPFRVGGTVLCSDGGWPRHQTVTITPALAVALFIAHVEAKGLCLTERIQHELRGHDLACWCPLDEGTPCHADVLLRIANAKGGIHA